MRTRKIGRYELKSQIGQGGMGVVFCAHDPLPMDRDVAIKTLPEFADRKALDLFYKECHVLKSIHHPNIVDIFDMGEFEEGGARRPYFVMPLLQGQTLEQIIKTARHSLTVTRVVDIIFQACRGLQAAHERGLVHRDLKPSNLFVIGDDAVKIIDFGLAQAVDAHSRSGGFNKGTLLYMAPEQVEGRGVSVQSDIFALGVVCYEALTRSQPFRRGTTDEIIEAIRTHTPPPASELNPSVSQVISQAVHKAMAKEPRHRYESAKDFGDILQKAAHNEPIEIFDAARIQPRIDRATQALDGGDYQLAGEIVGELESAGNVDGRIARLRSQVDHVARQRTIDQLLESARTRYEEEEDPLALQKLHEVLQLDDGNVLALALKSRIENRRSERLVDKWLGLAQEHVVNRSFAEARQALKNALDARPNESRALRLAQELEAEEQEYLGQRREKAALYQSAVEAYRNGDLSHALSQIRLVLDLDGRAPDRSSPDTAGLYQTFFNKIRSEHEVIRNGYGEARRRLAESDFAKALEICVDFLKRYPGQPLFQALKFDVEEQQRQQFSGYIVDVNRRLEAEPDLDAKVSLVREAVSLYPGEPHFEQMLKLHEDKRDLVSSIVAKARRHESDDQISEAISDFETLKAIYPAYPGLKYEIDRLEKRRDQHNRDSAKAEWVRQIDRRLEIGHYSVALALIGKAEADFPGDREFSELRKQTEQGMARSQAAEQLLVRGQALRHEGRLEECAETLRQAHRLDERSPHIHAALRDVLSEAAGALIETDWQQAEVLSEEALQLDPQDPGVKAIRDQIADRKREDTIAECAAEARRLQTDGELEQASAVLKRGLAIYPRDPRLTVALDTVERALGQSNRRKARLNDFEEPRGPEERVRPAAQDGELRPIAEPGSRQAPPSNRGPVEAVGGEAARVDDKGGRRPSPPDKGHERPASAASASKRAPATPSVAAGRGLNSKALILTAAAVALLVGVAVGWIVLRKLRPLVPPGVSAVVHISTTPPGAVIAIDHKAYGTSDVQVTLAAGSHLLEATLPGYANATETVSLTPGLSDHPLLLKPLPHALRLVLPDLVNGDDASLDDVALKLEGGSLTASVVMSGDHLLRIGDIRAQPATVAFATQPGAMPTVKTMDAPQRQVVAVTSLGPEARVFSTLGGLIAAIDDKPQGTLGADGLAVRDLQPGVHELTIGEGKNLRKMSFTVGADPSLDVIVYSDRDVGSILVLTGESDVTVLVDGKEYRSKTVKGQVRLPGLPSREYVIRVIKEGYVAPEPKTVAVVKGQEAGLIFALIPQLKLARLEIQGAMPGLQISLEDIQTLFGTVSPNGSLSGEIALGLHTLRLSMDGYQSKQLKRSFTAGDTVLLSGADVELQPVVSVLPVIVPTPVLVAPTPAVSAGGMEHFEDAAKWIVSGTWYKRVGGGFALYDNRQPRGRIAFTLKPRRSRFFRDPHIRWMVAFRDAKNYVLIDVDSKSLSLVEVVDDKRHELPRIQHGASWDGTYIQVALDITETKLTHQFGAGSGSPRILDIDRSSLTAPSEGTPRNFTDGQFGFYLPGSDEVEISNFAFYPAAAH